MTVAEQQDDWPVPGLAAELDALDELLVAADVYQEQFEDLPVLRNPELADELVSVNFNDVGIRMMLKTIGDITGINFVIDERVTGTVTVISPTKVRLGDVYQVLESVLEVKGYAAVPAGNLVKIIPKAEAARGNLQVRIGGDPAQIPRSDSVVTQIIPVKYADAEQVSQIIRPLLASTANLSAYKRTNSIVVTDTCSNIHRVARIIRTLDVAGSREKVTVIPLKYASAQMLSEQITEILQKRRAGTRSASRNRAAGKVHSGARTVPDLRTNCLIVVGDGEHTATVRHLVSQLDIERPSRTSNVHVVYLKNAPATETARSLTEAVANLKSAGALKSAQQVQVTADEGTNALIIAASAQDYEVISRIIEKLDIVREQVLVELLIMEVTEDSLKEIGIDWATLDEAVAGSMRVFGQTNFGPRVDFATGDLEGLAVGIWKQVGSGVSIGTILSALEKKSGINILSTPHIMTSNHSKAKIVIGENIPFVVTSRVTESDPASPTVIKTFEYKDVGISLELTPHISQSGMVRLEIDSQFTKLLDNVAVPTTDTPTTAKRQAQTVVSIQSGSTVVIGGLIRDDKVTTESKIPLIGDIPVLGELFKFKKDRVLKTNLLIFITPYVMSSQKDMQEMTEKKTKQMQPLLQEKGMGYR